MCSILAITITAGGPRLDAAGCRIVTRLKSNTPLHTIEDRPITEGGADPVRSRRIFARPPSQEPKNLFDDPVREIRVCIETGKILRILTNDLDASAEEIALIQAPLGDRTLLPLGETKPQDQEVPRGLGKRHPHSDRSRPHRLSASQACSCRAKNGTNAACLYPVSEIQPHAPETH